VDDMIEYMTALILIVITYIVAITNVKLPIFGYIIIFVDLVAFLPEPISTGQVIIGYTLSGSIPTPIFQTFSWLQYVIIVGIALSSLTAVLKTLGEI
jgi:hypothetical protein